MKQCLGGHTKERVYSSMGVECAQEKGSPGLGGRTKELALQAGEMLGQGREARRVLFCGLFH